jgi:hypothetical protein
VQTIIAKGGGGGTSRLRSAAAAVAVAVAVAVAASRVPQFSQLIRFKQTILVLCIQPYVFYQRNHAAPVLSTATATPSAAINNFVS